MLPPPAPDADLVDPSDRVVRRRRAVRWAAQARTRGGDGPVPRTLLLDVGGVVIPTLFESTAIPDFPAGPLGDDAAYAEVEAGRLQERDYWGQLIAARPDIDAGALWRTCSYVRAEIRAAVAAIAGRVRVVAFTNDMAHWFGDDWPERFTELDHFDQVVEASKLGVLKPAPASFEHAAAAVGEDPARCLFVDDLPANLDGAAAVGMATLHFDVRDPAAAIARMLDRLGIAGAAAPRRRSTVFVVPRSDHRP
ncbi:MAG: HAD-IA family hydrolase [Actinobacteria bacterium]|nr:HAD-IA family hydrolase [Actinomycetota bacterium]